MKTHTKKVTKGERILDLIRDVQYYVAVESKHIQEEQKMKEIIAEQQRVIVSLATKVMYLEEALDKGGMLI